MILLDVYTFFSRLHPLIVHLPVGFFLLAAFFHFISYIKKYEHLRLAVSLTLLTGFISAVLACVFGYMLSLTGEYASETLFQHKVTGITLAVLSGVLYLLTTNKLKVVVPRNVFSLCLVGLIFLLGFSSHQGGSLTHGDDYLSLKTLTQKKRKKPAQLSEAFIFEDVVQPILDAKCSQCHMGNKLKGRLSVATLAGLLKGGKSGPAVVAGKLEESELYKRITLDPDHEKFMPSDGRTPLKKSEVAIVKWWIEKAGAIEGQKLLALKNNETIAPRVSAYLGLEGGEPSETVNEEEQNINPDIPRDLDMALVENIRKKGLMVRIMLHKPAMLDISMPSGDGRQISQVKNDLAKVAKNIVWLNLSGANLSDKDIDFVSQCINIEKLRLENNPLSDSICNQLVTLNHLEAVNLNDTRVTEKGIAILQKNQGIKRIYNWHSTTK